MKTIYVLLTKSKTLVSRAIGYFTGDKYTHAAISFCEDLQPIYSMSRQYVHLPLPAKMTAETINGNFYMVHFNVPYALYKVEVSDEAFSKTKAMVEQMYTQRDKHKFNVIGLILCKMHIPWNRKYKKFCSQFVSEVLMKNDVIHTKISPSLVRPIDFTRFPELRLVSRGNLNKLRKKIARIKA